MEFFRNRPAEGQKYQTKSSSYLSSSPAKKGGFKTQIMIQLFGLILLNLSMSFISRIFFIFKLKKKNSTAKTSWFLFADFVTCTRTRSKCDWFIQKSQKNNEKRLIQRMASATFGWGESHLAGEADACPVFLHNGFKPLLKSLLKPLAISRAILWARPEMSFADFGRPYFNRDFSAFYISALA